MLRPISHSLAPMACLLAAALVLAAPAGAAQAAGRDRDATPWSAHLGGGFTLSPDAGLLATGIEYELAPGLGLGPLLQLGLDDDVIIVAPTGGFRYRFDLSHSADPVVRRLEPFVQAGLGFAYIDKDRRGRSDREGSAFLLNGGLGLDVRVDPRLSLGSAILFNGMPADGAAGEHFFFSWQLLTARVHF